MSLNDLIGRRFEFNRNSDGTVTPVRELKSATWLHPDGPIVTLSGEFEIDPGTEESRRSLDDKGEGA